MKKVLFIGFVVLVSLYGQSVVSPFAAVWVDDDYPVAEDTDGDMYFRTLTAAVNAVYENGTINVYPGLYTPTAQISLKNGVLLTSVEGASTTIIDFVGVWCGYWSTGTGGVDIPYGVSHATIDGFTIKGGSSASDALISVGGCNNCVQNNIVIGDPASGGQDIGVHIGDLAQGAQQLPSGNAVLNNHIYDHAGAGVFVGNWAGTNNVISGNTIHDTVIGGVPGLNGNGIELDRAYSATVINNIVYNNEATGIKIVRAPGNAVFKITYNVITGNPTGVLNDSWFTNTVLVEVTCNDIINNGIGVQNNESTIITAKINWWGSTTGPYHFVLNPAGTGDIVSDNVDFAPWGLHADPCRSRTSQQHNTPVYGQHMCPVARKNLQEGTSLLMEVEKQLTQAKALDVDTAEIEELLDEAKALLEQARVFCKNSQNCIAGNTLALQAQTLLREIQDLLESMLA